MSEEIRILDHKIWWDKVSGGIEYGKCWCGCGLTTPLASKTRYERFHIKDKPVRYLHGHGGRRTEPVDGKLICSKCGENKPVEQFYENGHRKNKPNVKKYQTVCKTCIRKQMAQVRYNITEKQFEDLFTKAAGRCAICKEETDLVIDHDHITGEVRGLLCGDCNRGIGFLDENPKILASAIKYVQSPSISVLDHGFIKLQSSDASDLNVINSAKVSFGVIEDIIEDGTDRLIHFLMRERHGTPFESSVFTFHIKAPLFVAREWMRHRIGSYNELSGRYKKFENPDFYLPENWRSQVGKPGAYYFEEWSKTNPKADRLNAIFVNHYKDCVDTYNYAIEQGVAKELARLVLPLAMYTEFY